MKGFKALKIIGRIILGILLLLFLLILFIRSPWGQDIIVTKAVSFLSNKTKTKVGVEKLFITFDGDIQLENLYLEDTKGDTLIYSKSLDVNIPIWALIQGNGLGVDGLDWEGVRANITRKDTIQGFNFQFIIDAFASQNPKTTTADTTQTPLNLILGKLRFKNFDVVYNDAVTGIDSRFKIGKLVANMDETSLESLNFEASKLALTNSQIKFYQTTSTKTPDSQSSKLPRFAVAALTLNNVYADYKSQENGMAAIANISDFFAEIPAIDLDNQIFDLDEVRLKNSEITLKTETQAEINSEFNAKNNKAAQQPIKWPEIQLAVGRIDLENNKFSYLVNNQTAKAGVFNPGALVLSDINMKAKSVLLKNELAQLQLNTASFNDISGIQLKNLQGNLEASNTRINLSNLKIALNKNTLEGNLQLDYPSLANLITAPELSKVRLNIPAFKVALQDLFLMQPNLKENKYLQTLSKNIVSGSLKAGGYLSDMNLENMLVNWSNTKISASGSIQNVTNPDKLAFNILPFSVRTKRLDILKFIDQNSSGLNLPNDVKLAGRVSGSLNTILAKAKLTTSQGIANIEGQFKNTETLTFNAQLEIDDYALNELLKNEELGNLSVSLKANGKGANINSLDAEIDANIKRFSYNTYQITNLKLAGDIKDGTGSMSANYKDENLNANLAATVILDSIAPQVNAKITVIGADLEALGLMDRDVKTAMNIQADFNGNGTNFNLETTVDDGVFVFDNKSYLLGNINAMAHVRKDSTSVSVKNKMVDLQLQSNANPEAIIVSLRRHVSSYFFNRFNPELDSLAKPVNLKIQGKISKSPILNEVFLVNLVDMDTVDIAVNYKESERKLQASVTIPYINYSNLEVDDLAFTMNSDLDKFNFNLGFNEVTAGPLNIQKTVFSGNQTSSGLLLEFTAFQDEAVLTQVFSRITGTPEEFRFHVQPDNLIFNKADWDIPDTNEMLIYDRKLVFNDFQFSKGNQAFQITDKSPKIAKEHIAINFKNFKLSEFLSYLNSEEKLASGNLNGDLILEEPFAETGVLADLDILDFQVLDVNMGSLNINAESLGGTRYDFNAHLKGGEIDLDLVGEYVATKAGANLDLGLDINTFNMTALSGFSDGQLTNASGSFSGRFDVTGTTRDPEFTGNILFNEARFKVAMFNSAFSLKQETITINNAGLAMNGFTIRDANGNKFEMSGEIGTKSFINPTFDLQLKADDFQVLNATKEDNDFLYGKAGFDGNAKITGNLLIPKIDMDMTVTPDTDVTYVLPSAAVNVEERDGVVVFVNRDNPDAILTRTKTHTATIKGLDISALIKVSKEATVTLILDKETGDNFKVSGEGDFNMSMNPNGNLRLSGVYEVLSGHYELNLYQIVNRKFNLVPGSRVTWSGDPFDAKLDVKAKYTVETSASALMAPVYSGSDPAVKGKFRQVLPFFVYLNINGQLLEPEIAFNLDMPEEKQGAVGGQVYGRIQQLNNQEDELNRQVFSLLVLNRFYPDPGSDGSTGGVASIARNNLNDAVADQLNMFSDKLLGSSGFELDFGLNSYTDYQGSSPKQRTQLDIAAQKKLFDDRLIVRVGSEVDIEGSSSTGEDAPIIGNVSIEYLLTESGRYRLKGFSRNEFENVIDGQTVVSGIALIFTQEFNKYNELWDALFKRETNKEKEEKAQKELKKQAMEEKKTKNEGEENTTKN